MKKIFWLVSLIVVLSMVLSACGGQAAQAPAEKFRVAVVMPSAINDLAFSQSMYDALVRIQTEMGGPDKVKRQHEGGRLTVRAEQTDAFRRLARVRLDTLAEGEIGQRLDRAEREALALLSEKRKALADLAEKRKSAASTLAEAQGTRREIAGRLEEINEAAAAV